jgi:hypothetical protein
MTTAQKFGSKEDKHLVEGKMSKESAKCNLTRISA